MAQRTRLVVDAPKNSYFTGDKPVYKFTGTGCAVLDSALGGGYALGHTVNVVGDKSTSKTGLATEALINFLERYPKGEAAYRETEASYDRYYAQAMGLNVDRVNFGNDKEPILTVEDFINDYETFLDERLKKKTPGIYILDSLDSISDDEEMETPIEKGTYGMAKAKKLSIMFRKLTRKQEQAEVLLFIVSQVRDNIGVLFGEKNRRSGGRALNFYASQIIWLAQSKVLKRTINKIERAWGIEIKASIKKNKIGLAHREANFVFEFGFGVNDLLASVDWLKEVGRLDAINLKDTEYRDYVKEMFAMSTEDYHKERIRAAVAVKKLWAEVDETFLPKRRKYF